jgi:hypothetical protein
MSTKHMPGHWRYEESTKTVRSVPSNYWLATLDSWDKAVDHEANARLIAAAPDAIEVCRLVSMFYAANPQLLQVDPRVRVYVEAARAAIAKAEGEK